MDTDLSLPPTFIARAKRQPEQREVPTPGVSPVRKSGTVAASAWSSWFFPSLSQAPSLLPRTGFNYENLKLRVILEFANFLIRKLILFCPPLRAICAAAM